MKVDFKNYTTQHCKYCLNYKTENCVNCIKSNDYISYPSRFVTKSVIEQEYFLLLSDYSKLLYNMGFEIVKGD